jgi:lambda family phage portal protein
LNPDTGEPIAVHVSKYHPGEPQALGNAWTRVPIRGESTDRLNVIHLFDSLRPGQARGVPWFAPVLETLKQIGKWSDSELNAAVVSSLWAVFMEMDAEAFDELFEDDAKSKIVNDAQKWSGKIESGKVVNLLPGEKAEMKTPGRPNPAFDPFYQAMVARLGTALGIPKEVLLMHFQSSYTAARGAFMMAGRRWITRREKIAKMWCQPIYELWLAHEVAAGRIACPGFFASKMIRAAWCSATWTGDGFGSVDPVKDVTAAKMRVEMGISTLQAESVQYDGVDWDTKQRQRAKEVARQREDGTLIASSSSDAPPILVDPGDNGSDDDTEAPPAAPAPAPALPTPQPSRTPAPQRRLPGPRG